MSTRPRATPPAPTPQGSRNACGGCDRDEMPIILRFFMIHNMTMRIADRLTAPVGLTSSRWMLLCNIAHREEAPRISDLSVDAMLSAQNVSRMIASLESDGLVERFTQPGAGRAVFVRLTAAGNEAFEKTKELGARFDTAFLAGISEESAQALAQQLDALIDNLDRFEQALTSEAGPDARGGPHRR